MPKNHPEQKNQPPVQRGQAGTTFSLRLIAAGYLIYLAWTLMRDLLNGSSTLPAVLGWAASVCFAAAGVGFGIYAWKRYRSELRGAEQPEPMEENSFEEPDNGDSEQ